LDVEKLRQEGKYDEKSLGTLAGGLGSEGRGFGVPLGRHWGAIGASLGSGENGSKSLGENDFSDSEKKTSEKALIPGNREKRGVLPISHRSESA
jgi:hypothetical protein